jgi:hypothetical protein
MTMEKQSFSCPNPSCGKAFPNPIRAENLNSKNSKPYDACPYCLTEITVAEIRAVPEEKHQQEMRTIETKEEIVLPTREKPEDASPKPQKCAHHLGYLSQRSAKEKFPEDCMTCENIVKCMLKAVTGQVG